MQPATPRQHPGTLSLPAVSAIGGAIAGCAQPAAAGARLYVGAEWQPWSNDPLPHLYVTLTNLGDRRAFVGPTGDDILVHGPAGLVRVEWGETPFARPILPHHTVVVGLHPRSDEAGLFVLAIDHAWGEPADPPTGNYRVCLSNACHSAALEPTAG